MPLVSPYTLLPNPLSSRLSAGTDDRTAAAVRTLLAQQQADNSVRLLPRHLEDGQLVDRLLTFDAVSDLVATQYPTTSKKDASGEKVAKLDLSKLSNIHQLQNFVQQKLFAYRQNARTGEVPALLLELTEHLHAQLLYISAAHTGEPMASMSLQAVVHRLNDASQKYSAFPLPRGMLFDLMPHYMEWQVNREPPANNNRHNRSAGGGGGGGGGGGAWSQHSAAAGGGSEHKCDNCSLDHTTKQCPAVKNADLPWRLPCDVCDAVHEGDRSKYVFHPYERCPEKEMRRVLQNLNSAGKNFFHKGGRGGGRGGFRGGRGGRGGYHG